MTQQDLADCAQIERGYLSKIENNKRPAFGSDILLRVARCLKTSADYLLGLAEDEPPEVPSDRDEHPDHVAKFNYLLEALPAHMHEEAIEYLRQQLRLWTDAVVPAKERAHEPAGRHTDAH